MKVRKHVKAVFDFVVLYLLYFCIMFGSFVMDIMEFFDRML